MTYTASVSMEGASEAAVKQIVETSLSGHFYVSANKWNELYNVTVTSKIADAGACKRTVYK